MASGHVYIAERQVEFWTDLKIIEDLQASGFDVTCVPIDQHLEKRLALDAVFLGDRVKLFGLQHKVLYSGTHDYWRISPSHQLGCLQSLGWGYYCFSDMKASWQAPQALHLARFVDPGGVDPSAKRVFANGDGTRGTRVWYSRWGAFATMMSECLRGTAVHDKPTLIELLTTANGDGLVVTTGDVVLVGLVWGDPRVR